MKEWVHLNPANLSKLLVFKSTVAKSSQGDKFTLVDKRPGGLKPGSKEDLHRKRQVFFYAQFLSRQLQSPKFKKAEQDRPLKPL
ncbi:hypothetical protein [Psychrobacter sp. H7-1]|uniref:hypothetical protein n=1 Tax=Psychrobacter sp. H7-1 TaxID=1569265 RepID=UPI0019180434|nr:hypothetical protein [Psychrobacter sp. H7-1]